MCFQIIEDVEIIQKQLHEHAKIFFKNHIYNFLVGWWCVLRFERHD